MPSTTITVLDSIDQLRAAAKTWDDLWSRSRVTLPTARAELIAQWHEQFAPAARFRAVLVERDGELVAALPLVGRRLGPLVEAAALPGNEWCPGGDLLLDESADCADALDALVAALDRLPWNLVWLDTVPVERPHWTRLLEAVQRRGLSADYHEQFRVALFDVAGDWTEFCKSRSRNHKRQMSKLTRDMQDEPRLAFHFETNPDREQVSRRMASFFDVEDRSWKGDAGSSILRSEGMPEFLTRQAEQMAEWGQLNLAWLSYDDQPIAFEYSWSAKGHYHPFKVGYDAAYSSFSPGQLLTICVLQKLFEDPSRVAMDCLGPLNQASQRWRPNTYGVGRLVIAPNRILGQALLYAYKNVWPVVRRLRDGKRASSPVASEVPAPDVCDASAS